MSEKQSQIWDVPISHEERFLLFGIAFPREGASVIESGPDGKKFRRMARAFGLASIRETARKNDHKLATKPMGSTEQRLFKVTAENVEVVLEKLTKVKRTPGQEMDLGELFDRLDLAKANGEETADVARRAEWAKVPVFDLDEDATLWTPPGTPPDVTLTCPSCSQDFSVDEARAAHAAAHSEQPPASPAVE